MADHVTIVQLSDLHITPIGERLHGADTAANLRRVAAYLRAMHIAPDAILISGDLTHAGEEASYTHLQMLIGEELAPFGAPVLLTLGNHDRRVPFRRVILKEQVGAADEDAFYYYSRQIGPVRVIMLDSKISGSPYGALGDAQLAWLQGELQEPAPAGHLIVVHHPLVPRGLPRAEDYLLRDRDALLHVIAGHAVLGVLCGHTHVSTVAPLGRTLTATAPGCAFLLDPSIAQGGRILDGAGFNLCIVRNGRLLVNPVILPGEQRELLRYNAVTTVNDHD
jgi:3',5'-cyclic AMP phosphodiesterase CpdA